MQLTDLRVTLASGDAAALDTPLLAIALQKGSALPPSLSSIDAALGGAIKRALDGRDFRGGRDESLALTGGARGPRRVCLIGIGSPAAGAPTAAALRRAASLAARSAGKLGAGSIAFAADFTSAEQIESAVAGVHAGAWQWTETRSAPPDDERRAPVTRHLHPRLRQCATGAAASTAERSSARTQVTVAWAALSSHTRRENV